MSSSIRRRIARTLVGCALLLAGAAGMAHATGSVTYTYDALGRVTTVTYSSGAVMTYTYDPAGNRTQQATTGGSGYPNFYLVIEQHMPHELLGHVNLVSVRNRSANENA